MISKKLFSLEGLHALVTGAAGSIGLKTAIALSIQGARVTLLDYREQTLKSATKLVSDTSGNVANFLVKDLSDLRAVKDIFGQTEKEYGIVDILVNNAGINKDCLFMKMTDNDLDTVMDLNFKAPFLLCQTASLSMAKRRFGRIINISSVVAFSGNPGQANYCSSKSALLGLTKTIALEYAKRGVTANCIAPGAIKSPMTENLSETAKQAFLTKIPMGYMGEPDDVASVIAFLSSREAGYITGQTIHVNGGMLMV